MKWLPLLFLACMACSKPYVLTASLQNSPWFGSGEIVEIHSPENKTCAVDRFSIVIRTDLPFQQKPPKSATGCAGKCTPTQWLQLAHIPLQKGIYDLTLPDTCLPIRAARSPENFKVGRATLMIMDTVTGRTQQYYHFSEGDKGWVEVTKLDRKSGQIRGRFDLSLSNSTGQTVHFKRGRFKSQLVPK